MIGYLDSYSCESVTSSNLPFSTRPPVCEIKYLLVDKDKLLYNFKLLFGLITVNILHLCLV